MSKICTSFYLCVLLFGFYPFSFSLAQDFRIKTAYDFSSPSLQAAQKFYEKGIDDILANRQEAALQNFEAAHNAYDNIAKSALRNQDFESYIYSLERRANVERRIFSSEKALLTLELAKEAAQNHLSPYHFLLAKIYTTAGVIMHRDNQYYEARNFLDSAQMLYQKATTYDSSLFRTIIDYKYYAYQYAQGSQDTLLKYLGIRYELEESKAKPTADELLYILQDYPSVFLQKGDYEQALAYALRSFKFSEENSEKLSIYQQRETLYTLANVLIRKKKFSESLDIAQKSLNLTGAFESREQKLTWFNVLGIIYLNLEDYEQALTYFEAIQGIQTQTTQEEVFKASIWLNIGRCYINMGEREKGKEKIFQALDHLRKFLRPPSQDFVQEYVAAGDYEMLEENLEKALIMYDSALRNGIAEYKEDMFIFPESMDVEISISDLQALQKKSLALEKLSQIQGTPDRFAKAGLEYVNRTHRELVKNRSNLIATEGKLFLSEQFKRLYESGISICYQLFDKTKDPKYAQQGLRFIQLSKGNLLLEQSEEYAEVSQNIIPLDLKQQFYETKKLIEELESNFYLSLDNSATSDSIIQLNDALLDTKKDLSLIKDTIATFLSSNPIEDQLESSIAPQIPSNTAMIDYFYGEDFIYAYLLSRDEEKLFRIDDPIEVQKNISALFDIVSRPPQLSAINKDLNSFNVSASYLYQQLLAPILASTSKEINSLWVVPDDVLSRIPFEVLIQPSAEEAVNFKNINYLINDYRIQYLISSKPKASDKNKADSKQKKGLFGIGFSGQNSEQLKSTFGALPGTENEIRFLESNYEGLFLYGQEGSKSRFLHDAKNYDVLHLAIHGQTDLENKYQSTLIFNGENNLLKTSELYLADLRARLAILSACESGAGAISSGEGTFSIARGFSIVGVPTVAVSLWKVSDAVTSSLMVSLYEKFIDDGLSFNHAMHQTKLNYLATRDSYASHPFYWAAFVHLGEDLYYAPSSQMSYKWLIGGLLLFFLVAFMFYAYMRALKKQKKDR